MAKHTFTANDIKAPYSQKLHAWSNVVQRAKWPVVFTKSSNASLDAEMQQITLGPFVLYIYETGPSVAKRKVDSNHGQLDESFSIHYINSGSLRCKHNGKISLLTKGDMVLSYNAIDSIIEILEKTQTLSLKVPKKYLDKHVDNPQQYCNFPIYKTGPYNEVLKELFFSLWRQGKSEAYNGSFKVLVDTYFQIFPLIFEDELNTVSSRKSAALLFNISNYIDNNISNVALSPDMIAREFNVSCRYLRKIFQEKGINCLSAHIRFLRLEKSAMELVESTKTTMSVTELAYKWGFGSSSSFSRAFKEYFGVTPTQYRDHSCRDQ